MREIKHRTLIIQSMQENPKITVSKLAKQLKLSSTTVEKNIQYLKTHGYIKRHGPAKGGYWEVIEENGGNFK